MNSSLSQRVIILAPLGRDSSIAASILQEAGFTATICGDISSLCSEITQGAGLAIIAEEAARSDDLSPLADYLEKQPSWSDLPIILLTQKGSGPERNPAAARLALILGNVTFIERPFHPTTLTTAVRTANRGRRRQYEARTRLEELDTALKAGQLGSWTLDLPSLNLRASERCRQHFGRAANADFTYSDLAEAIHLEDRQRWREAVHDAVTTGGDYFIEYRIKTPAGEERWMQVRGQTRYGDNGEPSHISGVSRDVTDRKQAEKELSASVARQKFRLELSDALRDLRDPRDIMEIASRLIGEHLGADQSNYYSIEGEDFVVEREWRRQGPGLAGRHRLADFGADLLSRAANGETLRIDDARSEKGAEAFAAAGMAAVLSAPLMREGRWTAGLHLHQAEPRVWRADEVALVTDVAERTWDAIKRSEAEIALRVSEDRYRTLTEALPQLVWTCLPDGRCDYLSRQWVAYTGMAEADQLELEWLDRVIHPEDRSRTYAHWMGAVKGLHPYDIEYRIRRHDGVYHWFKTRGTPIRDEAGRIVYWFGTSTNIQEIVEAREVLTRSRDELEREIAERTAERDRLWQKSRDLQVMVDPGGILHAVSPAWTSILGWLPEELVGRKHLDFIHPDDHAPSENALAKASLAELPAFENRFRHKNGGFKWISWAIAPEGGLIYASGRDVAAEKEAAKALQIAESRIRSIFETTYQFQAFLTPDGVLLDANPRSLEAIEASPDAVVGRSFWETPWFTATPAMPELIKTWIKEVAAGKTMRQETTLNLPRGPRSFDFAMRPVFDPSNQVIGIVPEAMDVTEQRQAEEALRQAQKMEVVGQLTGGIAHDFNNMLTGVMGAHYLMRKRIAAGRLEDLDPLMDAATQSAQRAANLTQRLLAFSRQQPLDFKNLDVNTLAEGMGELLRRTLGEHIHLEFSLASGVWPINTDSNQLESALLNLVINARDAMSDGGQLTIETSNLSIEKHFPSSKVALKPGHYTVIAVSDTGCGMNKTVLERVFEPFFTTKPIGQGTGLGLSMIYGFMKQSGGHVDIYSEEGKGTTVKMLFPRSDSLDETRTEVAAQAERLDARQGETILVVEDEPAVRLLITEVLKELGYDFAQAVDSESAIPILRSNRRIDLLVTDVGLPGMNGRQLAEVARNVRPELKVLFVTGYAEKAARRGEFLDAGMEMITKPFAGDVLGSKIRQLIEN